MPFALAEAYVDIGTNQKPLEDGLSSAKSKVESFNKTLQSISHYGMAAFAAFGAAKAIAVKAFSDSEEASEGLKTALKATGQEVDHNYQSLSDLADNLQKTTTYSRDAIKQQMAYATNLGVTADALGDVSKAGIGLGAALFNGNLEAGTKAVAEAYEGNFRELERLIPGMKNATTEQEKMNLVLQTARVGFEEAQGKTNTFAGQMEQLQNSSQTLAATFGAFLVPQLQKLTSYVQATVNILQNLSPAQKEQVVNWFKIGTAIAGVIAFGPMIIGFATTAITAFMGIGGAVAALGAGLVGLVTSPIAIVLAGFAGLAMGMAYVAGSGGSMVEKLGSGFLAIAGFIDSSLGSWQGFVTGLSGLWHTLEYYWAEVWLGIKSYAEEVWEYLKSEFPNIVYGWGSVLAKWVVNAIGAFETFADGVKKIWQEIVSYIASKMAQAIIKTQVQTDVMKQYGDRELSKKDADMLAAPEIQKVKNEQGDKYDPATGEAIKKQYEDQYAGKKLSDSQLQDLVNKETELRLAAAAQVKSAEEKARDDEHKAKLDAIEKETAARVAAINKWAADGKGESPADHAKDRAAMEKKNDEEKAKLEADRQKQIADDKAKLAGMPKLSDEVKALYEKVKSGAGISDILDLVNKIKGEAGNLSKEKADAQKQAGAIGNLAPVHQAGDKPQFTGIEEVFKRSLASNILGAATTDPKLKAQYDANKLAQKQNDLLKQVNDALKNLPAGIRSLLGLQ